MTRKQILPVLLILIFALPALAQDAKQEMHDRLWEAARKGDAAAVKALLDGGADVNAKFRYGTTALFKAAEKGHTEVVKVLLERGADVKVKDTFYGATAMTWALDHKHVEIVRLLLEKNTEDAGDVLMTGTREGIAELVRIAIAVKGGLKPDTLNAALSAATSDDKKAEIAEMLRKAGAVPPPEVDAATLQSYTGKYKGEPGPEIVVSFKDGKLFAAPAGQQPLALIAVDKTTFRPTAFDGLTVTFNVEGGKVTGFALKQGQNTTQLKKVE
jgi:hypothetical protein